MFALVSPYPVCADIDSASARHEAFAPFLTLAEELKRVSGKKKAKQMHALKREISDGSIQRGGGGVDADSVVGDLNEVCGVHAHARTTQNK